MTEMSASTSEAFYEELVTRRRKTYVFIPVLSGSVLVFYFGVVNTTLVHTWAHCTLASLIIYSLKETIRAAKDNDSPEFEYVYQNTNGRRVNWPAIRLWELAHSAFLSSWFVATNVITYYHLTNIFIDSVIYVTSLMAVLLVLLGVYAEFAVGVSTSIVDLKKTDSSS